MRNLLLGFLGVLLIIGSWLGAQKIISNKKKPKPKPGKVVKTVFVDTVLNDIVSIQVTANGNLKAKRRLELFSEVQGVFKGGTKLFKTGQSYKAGETLISVDASEYYASVQVAKSNFYNQVTAMMPDIRLDYPEFYEKWQAYIANFDMEKTTPKLPTVENEKEKYFVTGRNILSSYYNVKNLEQRLVKYRIRAPFSGVLTEAVVTEGALIRPGQRLGEFIDTDTYEMELSIAKEHASVLKKGEKVLLNRANEEQQYQGIVTRINGKVDQQTQTVQVFVEVQDPSLKEGEYLEAVLDAKKIANAIEVDRSLLQEENKVYVVRDSILDVIEVNPIYFSTKKVVLKGVPNQTVLLQQNVLGAYPGMLVSVYGKEPQKRKKLPSSKATN